MSDCHRLSKRFRRIFFLTVKQNYLLFSVVTCCSALYLLRPEMLTRVSFVGRVSAVTTPHHMEKVCQWLTS